MRSLARCQPAPVLLALLAVCTSSDAASTAVAKIDHIEFTLSGPGAALTEVYSPRDFWDLNDRWSYASATASGGTPAYTEADGLQQPTESSSTGAHTYAHSATAPHALVADGSTTPGAPLLGYYNAHSGFTTDDNEAPDEPFGLFLSPGATLTVSMSYHLHAHSPTACTTAGPCDQALAVASAFLADADEYKPFQEVAYVDTIAGTANQSRSGRWTASVTNGSNATEAIGLDIRASVYGNVVPNVPEPATGSLLLAGVGVVAWAGRRRKAASTAAG